MSLAVGFTGEVVIGVVGVGLGQRRGEIRIRYAAIGVIGERGRIAVRVCDRDMQFTRKKRKSKVPSVTPRDRWGTLKFQIKGRATRLSMT